MISQFGINSTEYKQHFHIPACAYSGTKVTDRASCLSTLKTAFGEYFDDKDPRQLPPNPRRAQYANGTLQYMHVDPYLYFSIPKSLPRPNQLFLYCYIPSTYNTIESTIVLQPVGYPELNSPVVTGVYPATSQWNSGVWDQVKNVKVRNFKSSYSNGYNYFEFTIDLTPLWKLSKFKDADTELVFWSNPAKASFMGFLTIKFLF